MCVQHDLLDEGGNKTGTTNRWCTGTVVEVSNGKNLKKTRSYYKAGEAAEMFFDEIAEQKEKSHKQVHELKNGKWNPKGQHLAGCWRMDVNSYLKHN